MHYFAGLTFEEIAEVTGLRLQSVRYRWAKGFDWLKDRLGRHQDSFTRESGLNIDISFANKPEPDKPVEHFEQSVIERTEEVIGDKAEAMRWLGTPIRALAYATPISLLHNREGREAVLTVLGRLEHGVL